MDLFSILGDTSMTAPELGKRLDLHPRGTFDFFDALVALGFLQRNGDGAAGRYQNTPAIAAFLCRGSLAWLGGLLTMLNSRLFGFWNGLGTALRTGDPQNKVRHVGQSVFTELYADDARLEEFLQAMSGVQMANFEALAARFDFTLYHSVCDVGGTLALLLRTLAHHYPHLL